MATKECSGPCSIFDVRQAQPCLAHYNPANDPKCLRCQRPVSSHIRWGIDCAMEHTVNGKRVPVSPMLYGKWAGHDPVVA